MLEIEEAVALLNRCSQCIEETEQIPLLDGVGRKSAEDVIAPMNQPPFSRSPLDGYAIKAEDSEGASAASPVVLEVIGEICAGQVFEGVVMRGQAVRIMTGAPMPDGTDTVIRQELTDYGEQQVKIYEVQKSYGNYCVLGEDYHKGDVLIKKGSILDSASIGVMAGAGLSEAKVFRTVRIGLISTGDEVLLPGTPLYPGKIYDSNLYQLGARLREMGLNPVWTLHCSDEPEKMAELIQERMQEIDLLVTTGGVSVGKKDIMHEVIRLLPAQQLFWKVAVKPGAPVLAAVYQGKPLICLSGNPFGAAVNFELLVRPVIANITGNEGYIGRKLTAVVKGEFLKKVPAGDFFGPVMQMAMWRYLRKSIPQVFCLP